MEKHKKKRSNVSHKDTQKDPGIVVEVKMGLKVEAGLEQIEQKAYYQDLQTHGCAQINAYSIASNGKLSVLSLSLVSGLNKRSQGRHIFIFMHMKSYPAFDCGRHQKFI